VGDVFLHRYVHRPHALGSAHGRTVQRGVTALHLRGDQLAMPRAELERLAVEPTLGLVEEPLGVARVPGDACERQRRSLPSAVAVATGDGAAVRICELLLDGAKVHPLLLERVALGKVELEGEDADVAGGNVRISLAARGRSGAPATVDDRVARSARLVVVLGALACALVAASPGPAAGS